ncbi:MAG: 2-C-methyl-D-erythritol 4-phosphate cytidylyltransferase [Planctomycetota bacterium]
MNADFVCCMIIPAAGVSSRYGGPLSKLDEDLGGRPVLQRTVEIFSKRDDVQRIVVAGPHDDFEAFKQRHGDKLGLFGVDLCKGGKTHRYETVAAALAYINEQAWASEITHIGVHDAARPCTPPEVVERVFEAAQTYDAVVPAIEASDTLKRTSAEAMVDENVDPLDAILGDAGKTNSTVRKVAETVSRENLVLVQTPQVFRAELLRRAYAQGDLSSTDDAGLVERLGEDVAIVEGDARNIKITRRSDTSLARAILGAGGSKHRETHKRF